MKYVLIIGDGMGDTPLEQLDGKTPLEALTLNAFDLAAGCEYGRVRTVPKGMAPGSDTAILSIFGNDPRTCYTGRSALEAAGMGITVPDGSISLRVNFCAIEEKDGERIIRSHNGGGIHGRDVELLFEDLLAEDSPFSKLMQQKYLKMHTTDTFRHIGVMQTAVKDLSAVKLTEPHNVLDQSIAAYMPHCAASDPDAKALCAAITELMEASYQVLKDHPVNIGRIKQGLLPANMLWPWGAAVPMTLENFETKYKKTGTVVSAVPLVWGIAALAGLKTPHVEGANGDLDTNYQGKVDAALQALNDGDDFVAVHVEAPDEMAHAGDLHKKMKAIQNVNDLVMQPMMDALTQSGEDFRMLIMCDHPTFLTTRTHDATPVPYAIYDSRKPKQSRKFSESEAMNCPLTEDGATLMERLLTQ